MRSIAHVSAIVLALVAVGLQSAGATRHEAQVWFGEAEAPLLARMLDELKVETVADIGAGGGEFTAFVARQLSSTVVFIATELPAKVSILSKGLESRGAANVRVVEGAPTETKLPDGSCDALILRTTYHHLDHPVELTESLFRTLRRGGTLFVIEQPRVRMDTGEWDGIMQPVLIEQLQQAGFVHERTVDPFGRPLYLVVLRKP